MRYELEQEKKKQALMRNSARSTTSNQVRIINQKGPKRRKTYMKVEENPNFSSDRHHDIGMIAPSSPQVEKSPWQF